jgi:hypothetical protein
VLEWIKTNNNPDENPDLPLDLEILMNKMP